MAQQTLLQASFGAGTLGRKALIVLGGSALVALGAQVSVPLWPVPMTLQTLAILLVGFTAGARLGAATLVAYLAEGAMGLPVFSGGHAGAAWLVGPTAGFLYGFVAMAWAAGWLAERGIARRLVGTALSALLVTALLYLPGVLWLAAATPLGLTGAINAGMVPFLLGDAVKAVIAALVVTGGWSALRSRRG